MSDVTRIAPGLIILFALGLVLHAIIIAERASQSVLSRARQALFGDDRPGQQDMIAALPHLWRWRKHRSYDA